MNTNDLDNLKDKYVQLVVDDMDISTLMEAVTDSIRDRLDDLPEEDVIAEIEDSVYNEILPQIK